MTKHSRDLIPLFYFFLFSFLLSFAPLFRSYYDQDGLGVGPRPPRNIYKNKCQYKVIKLVNKNSEHLTLVNVLCLFDLFFTHCSFFNIFILFYLLLIFSRNLFHLFFNKSLDLTNPLFYYFFNFLFHSKITVNLFKI